MGRKLILIGVWTVAGCLLISFIVRVGPRLITEYYVARLGTPSPATDAAMVKLKALGKWAVPSLLDRIESRDAALEELRSGRLVNDTRFGWDTSIIDFYDARRKSETECRADLCLYLLVPAWNAGWLTEVDQRRVLRCLKNGAVRLDGATHVYHVDGAPIRIEAHLNKLLAGGHETLWVQRKIELIERTSSVERVVPVSGIQKEPESYDIVAAGEPDPNVSLAIKCLNVRGEAPREISIQPGILGVGRHAIYVRVSVGPTTKRDRHQSEEPPWFESFVYGPIDVEVVPAGAGP